MKMKMEIEDGREVCDDDGQCGRWMMDEDR